MGHQAALTTVLITGASSGIGAATARRLDADGMRVFAGVEHDHDGAAALAGASERLTRIVLDVTDDQSIQQAIAAIHAQAPDGLDGLVNNAGVGFPGPLEILPLDALRRQLEINVVGQVAVSRAALPLLREAGGRLVFVGSVGGLLASPVRGRLPRLEVRARSDRRRLAPRARPRRHLGDPDRTQRDLDPDLGEGDPAPGRARGSRPARARALPRTPAQVPREPAQRR